LSLAFARALPAQKTLAANATPFMFMAAD